MDTNDIQKLMIINQESGLSGHYKCFLDKRYYYLADHLGSIRVVLTEQGNVDSWSDYYPFGKESRGGTTNNEPKEGFTGKEYDTESGLNYFGARFYNSDVGRWFVNDPLSGKYPGLSPYNYAANNPIFFVDPNGMEIVFYGTDEQKKIWNMIKENIFKSSTGKALYDKLDKDKRTFTFVFEKIPSMLAMGRTNISRIKSKNVLLWTKTKIDIEKILKGKSTTPEGTVIHELKHIEDALQDVNEFFEDQKEEEELDYHDRPQEIRAENTRITVEEEIDEIQRGFLDDETKKINERVKTRLKKIEENVKNKIDNEEGKK